MKHGIAKESVALTEYVCLLTTELVTINLVQPGLFYQSHILFLRHHLTLIVMIVDNLGTLGIEIRCF